MRLDTVSRSELISAASGFEQVMSLRPLPGPRNVTENLNVRGDDSLAYLGEFTPRWNKLVLRICSPSADRVEVK